MQIVELTDFQTVENRNGTIKIFGSLWDCDKQESIEFNGVVTDIRICRGIKKDNEKAKQKAISRVLDINLSFV
jgi:hypothetical protein